MESEFNKNSIEEFIISEMNYFKPMIERSEKYNQSELEDFRKETIKERKLRISGELFHQLNNTVRYGLFQGMKLNSQTWWGSLDLGAMCLGEYEKEVLIELEQEFKKNRKPKTFIDIGAADGYYAVGALFSGLVEKCICFELSPAGRENIATNHALNNSPGILEIHGDIFEDFEKVITTKEFQDSVILVDIEGSEFTFLNKETLSLIKEATIIIEIHNWIENFEQTYREFLLNASEFFFIEKIKPRSRDFNSFEEELRSYTDENRVLLFSESRPCQMRFLKLSPKTKSI